MTDEERDLDPWRPVKIEIYVPRWLKDGAVAQAKKRGQTLTDFIKELLRQVIKEP